MRLLTVLRSKQPVTLTKSASSRSLNGSYMDSFNPNGVQEPAGAHVPPLFPPASPAASKKAKAKATKAAAAAAQMAVVPETVNLPVPASVAPAAVPIPVVPVVAVVPIVANPPAKKAPVAKKGKVEVVKVVEVVSAPVSMDADSDSDSSSSSSGSSSSGSSTSSAEPVAISGSTHSQPMEIDSDAPTPNLPMKLVPKKLVPAEKRARAPSTAENEVKVSTVPAATYASPIQVVRKEALVTAPAPAPVVSASAPQAEAESDSSSDSDSDSDSDSSRASSSSSSSSDSDSDSEQDTTRPAMVGGPFFGEVPLLSSSSAGGAVVMDAMDTCDAVFEEPSPFTQPILSQAEAAEDLQRAKLALIQRLSIQAQPTEGMANMTQTSSQSSPHDASTILPFAQSDTYDMPLLSQSQVSLSQVQSLESHYSQAEPAQAATVAATAKAEDSDTDSSSSGSSSYDSDSDSETEGDGNRLSQSGSLAAMSVTKTPSALQVT